MSPMKRMFIAREPWISNGSRLPRVLDGSRLPDHGDLDLPGILELGLDLPRDVSREPESFVVGDPVGLDDDAQLPARLDRERLLDALEAVGDVLELLEPLDVRLQDLAPCTGPRRRQRVRAV